VQSAPQLAALRTSRPAAARNVAIIALAALTAVGLLLTLRRIAGALTADLGILPLTATLLVAAAIVLGGRALWRQSGVMAPPRVERAFAWGGTAAILLVSIGCAWPSAASLAWLLALPLFAGDHFSRIAFLNTTPASRGLHPRGPSIEPSELRPLSEGAENATPEVEVLQELTRTRDARGVESIRGQLRADFAAGQRHTTLHVGFCPPLERLPVVEVEIADGPDAVVKVVQAFAHGARLELRLSEPADEPCEVIVELCATPCARSP
jgi:hypothetical protein